MKLTMLLALGLSVAAEPTGTLTMACQGMDTITHEKAVLRA
jgi:hypothetical protein